MRPMLPDIRARLVDRFVFNFCLPEHVLAARLPDWLRPQLVGGSAVASFCVLDLERVTFGPVPDGLGVRNINCARRFGVVDAVSGDPCVFVDERHTNSRFGSFVTSLGFPGHHPLVSASIERSEGGTSVRVKDSSGKSIFAATVRPAANHRSELFSSIDAFRGFMASGVRSYCPAVDPRVLNVVDLHKEDPTFVPLEVDIEREEVFRVWPGVAAPLAFDSAFHTSGGAYSWKFQGQVQADRGA